MKHYFRDIWSPDTLLELEHEPTLFDGTKAEILTNLTRETIEKILPHYSVEELDGYIKRRERSRIMLEILLYVLHKEAPWYQIRSKFLDHNQEATCGIDAHLIINGRHCNIDCTIDIKRRRDDSIVLYMPLVVISQIIREFHLDMAKAAHPPKALITSWVRDYFRTNSLPDMIIRDGSSTLSPYNLCRYVSRTVHEHRCSHGNWHNVWIKRERFRKKLRDQIRKEDRREQRMLTREMQIPRKI